MNKETKQALLQQLATMQNPHRSAKAKMKEYNIKLRHLTVLTIISQKAIPS